MRTVDPIAAAWHVAGRGADIDLDAAPLAVTILGRRLVLFRDRAGDVAAFPDACPHRGTALSLGRVSAGEIVCPYHGWSFAGTGACTRIPSMGPGARLPDGVNIEPCRAVERDGLVWVSLDRQADTGTIPAFPTAASDPGMRIIAGDPLVWSTSAGRHVENILDLAHFPFVHPSTFGCDEAEVIESHEVTLEPGIVDCALGVTTRNPVTGDGYLYADLGPTIRLGYHYRVELPYRTTLEFAFPDGMRRALHEVATPTASDRCTVFWVLLVDGRLSSSDDEELAFARAVFAEDQPIIESQPPGVPVDRRAEIHVPADRLAVAYRRALRDWGVPESALI